ncbi:hypothetical protein HOLleu_20967 [Holothuria leucospilota]|uniref:Uncharacterized protein n=1 Tax=Holothuria leucospilota TaxID=206669 RepID=A0A9Q1BX09_HOLLE|nr:hypothetical protein HOLleu_20967 [Holothuria leucospilota]
MDKRRTEGIADSGQRSCTHRIMEKSPKFPTHLGTSCMQELSCEELLDPVGSPCAKKRDTLQKV